MLSPAVPVLFLFASALRKNVMFFVKCLADQSGCTVAVRPLADDPVSRFRSGAGQDIATDGPDLRLRGGAADDSHKDKMSSGWAAPSIGLLAHRLNSMGIHEFLECGFDSKTVELTDSNLSPRCEVISQLGPSFDADRQSYGSYEVLIILDEEPRSDRKYLLNAEFGMGTTNLTPCPTICPQNSTHPLANGDIFDHSAADAGVDLGPAN
ncbi:hypothetical protein DFH09DRAFT_206179 [Mycena vulgaris]|nr:hypothetical protein DFH09DRAFT_206179 [Mycena vulgaris]